jgi:hypothetical protein
LTVPDRPSPHCFKTSQPRELLASIEFSAEQADKALGDHGAWRWLVIAMTLAVQNACLCALDAGDEYGTKGMTRTDAREVKRWTREGRRGPPPLAVREPRIVSPLELLRRVADPYFLKAPWQLPLPHETQRDFDDLVDLRNGFLHFSDDGWTIDLREIPPLIMTACDIIRHLAVTQPAYLRRAESGHQERVRLALEHIVAAMEHYPQMDAG